MLELPFDPLQRAEQVENIIMKGMSRKYYRLRPARYYGGIATADLVGCSFLCAYCWNYGRNLRPYEAKGRYYSHHEIARTLLKIARRKGFNRIRLSGAEPLLGQRSFEHLSGLLEDINQSDPRMEFVLETNGLLMGSSPRFAKRLARFNRLQVRVSLKGWDEESFERVSGAEGKFFELPLNGIKNLIDEGVVAWPAIMYEIFGPEGIEKISKKLNELKIKPEELEIEYLENYPFVVENLKKRSIPLIDRNDLKIPY